jgi:hypothetical protein
MATDAEKLVAKLLAQRSITHREYTVIMAALRNSPVLRSTMQHMGESQSTPKKTT